MIKIKTQYPYIDSNGLIHNKLIKHYAEDNKGKFYKIKQNETGIVYNEAIDVYPCLYTYSTTNEVITMEGDDL